MALIAGVERHAAVCALAELAFAIFLLRTRRSRLLIFCYLLAAALFYCYGWLDTARFHRGSEAFARASSETGTLQLQGWISNYPRLIGGAAIASLHTTGASGELDVGLSLRCFDIGYGDSLFVTATVPASGVLGDSTEARRSRSMRSTGRAGFGRVRARDVRRLPGSGGSPLLRSVFWPLHAGIRDRIVRAMGDRAGVPLALVLGDKSRMRSRDSRAISVLGISHLFALSGLHLGLVLGVVLLFLAPLHHGKTVLLCIILGIYVKTVGDIVSLERAYTMVVIGCAAKTLQRPVRPVAVLGRALLLLLLLKPGSIYSVGFQFSFLATFAVLLCVGRMQVRRESHAVRRFCSAIRASLAVSGCAQLFILPLALRYFGEASLVTPFTTLLFLPPVFLLLLASGVCCIAAALSSDFGLVTFAFLGRGTDLFSNLLAALASVAPAPWRGPAPSLTVYYTGLVVLFWPRRRLLWKCAGGALMAISFFLEHLWLLP